ncbi:thiamine phosphate synthase [Shimazuella alba]|uniref:Thiamine-phosphate synthase n=1 Tax=Shimazuella alba TaxID=2690964 RepID=A0A6I4VSF3_9BACL|nr:thiamine phosphate synthase [Shimazuella alba]MXQ53361.1 thiamine phosphate synthase [Shimazuella alba]
MLLPDSLRLYLVTDEQVNLFSRTEAALRGGVTCVQLRMKQVSFETFLQTAKRFKQLCKQFQVPLIINDQVEIAKIIQADALHIGQTDLSFAAVRQWAGPTMPIGVSVHTVEQALQAEKDGAAYLGVGAMFSTPSKVDANLVSLKTLEKIKSLVRIPVVVIGGINQKTLSKVMPYQPDGVAIISAILSSPDPEQEARYFRTQLHFQVTGFM